MVRVDVQPLYDKLCPEWNLPDAAEKPATRLGVRSLVPEAVYAPGEPITFLVAMIENNQYRSGVGLKCRMIREERFSGGEKGECAAAEVTAVEGNQNFHKVSFNDG